MRALKLQLGDEVRRIGKVPDHIDHVKKIATDLFGIEYPGFRYIDEDGDLITILNQEEYLEACSILSGPLKLEVLDSEVVLLKRSSMLDPLNDNQNSFKFDSFETSSKVSLTLHFEGENQPQDHDVMIQTDEILLLDKETSLETAVEVSTEANLTADIGVSCEFTIDGNQVLRNLIREQLKAHNNKEKNEYLGVKCIKCRSDIYDILFKCSQCAWLYLCEECETVDNHSHVLIKSRNVIPRSPSKSTELKTSDLEILQKRNRENTQGFTERGDRNQIDGKIKSLKDMGFNDPSENIQALIKANYNLEKSVDILVSR